MQWGTMCKLEVELSNHLVRSAFLNFLDLQTKRLLVYFHNCKRGRFGYSSGDYLRFLIVLMLLIQMKLKKGMSLRYPTWTLK